MHVSLMPVVLSAEAQETNDVADVLDRTQFNEGSTVSSRDLRVQCCPLAQCTALTQWHVYGLVHLVPRV